MIVTAVTDRWQVTEQPNAVRLTLSRCDDIRSMTPRVATRIGLALIRAGARAEELGKAQKGETPCQDNLIDRTGYRTTK